MDYFHPVLMADRTSSGSSSSSDHNKDNSKPFKVKVIAINANIPTELMEMILLAAGLDWQFVMSMVCRRWRDILSAWRSRGKRNAKLKTPFAVAVYTIPLAMWAHENGMLFTARTCEAAAHYGRLDVLQWARANGCPWNSKTCEAAAANGHLDVLKWAVHNGCNWHMYKCLRTSIHNNHVAVILWIMNIIGN